MDIQSMLKELTLEEKAKLTMGLDAWTTFNIDRLNIKSIRMCDGPHGLRKQYESEENNVGLYNSVPATCFPPAALTSCSFNRKLIYKMGEAIAKEAILQDVDIILGPAINIKRSPLCGRNFEYVSEDPYLTSEYAVEFINGVQDNGIGTSLKHFAVNNQESLRMNINAVVDERTLREIYLYSFEKAIKRANPYTIMAAYNKINGEYSSENNHILKKILRSEWKYKGAVISDWGAINDKLKSIKNGCDLEMPYSGEERVNILIEAVKSGKLEEKVLDEAVINILNLINRCNLSKEKRLKTENSSNKLYEEFNLNKSTAKEEFIENKVQEKTKKLGLSKEEELIYEENNKLAKVIAEDSMVLLKNEDNILPLNNKKAYALIGEFAEKPRYQGGGSSHITETKLTSMLDICKREKINFTYSKGYDVNSEKVDNTLIKKAKENAKNADIAIVFIGLTDIYEYEGIDRKDLNLPLSHLELLKEVESVNKNVVVVLCAGSAVNIKWDSLAKGILYASVMGQAGSEAIYNIIFGEVNPSGKLSETFPLKIEDTPCFENFPGGNNSVYYMEGIFVSYRYYNTFNIPVKYPFGFGLSYTSFNYSQMEVDKNVINYNGVIKCKLKIKNTGKLYGGEVVQIYIRDKAKNKNSPRLILKNFEKVYLNKGEEKEVVFKINYEDFTYYDVHNGWIADSGVYEIIAASSSIDLRQSVEVQVIGKEKKDNKIKENNHHENIYKENNHKDVYKENDFNAGISNIKNDSKESSSLIINNINKFKESYGRELPPLNIGYEKITLNTPLKYCTNTLIGKILYKYAKREIENANKGEELLSAKKAMIETLKDTPIRFLVTMEGGNVNLTTGEGIVKMMNGKFFSGLKLILKSIH